LILIWTFLNWKFLHELFKCQLGDEIYVVEGIQTLALLLFFNLCRNNDLCVLNLFLVLYDNLSEAFLNLPFDLFLFLLLVLFHLFHNIVKRLSQQKLSYLCYARRYKWDLLEDLMLSQIKLRFEGFQVLRISSKSHHELSCMQWR
jgi:hypothetical protein